MAFPRNTTQYTDNFAVNYNGSSGPSFDGTGGLWMSSTSSPVASNVGTDGVLYVNGSGDLIYHTGNSVTTTLNSSVSISGGEGTPSVPLSSDSDTGFYEIGIAEIGLTAGSSKFASLGKVSNGGTAGIHLVQSGSKTLPELTFGDLDTGIFGISGNKFGISAGDTEVLQFSSTGTVAAKPLSTTGGALPSTPEYGLSGDAAGAGMYLVDGTADSEDVGFSVAGAHVMSLKYDGTTRTVEPSVALRGSDGTAGAPAYSFSGDPDTGMFSGTADTLELAAGGNTILTMEASQITAAQQLLGPEVDKSTPTYSFTDHTDTGMYANSGDIAFSVDNSDKLTIGTSAITSTLPVIAPLSTGTEPSFTFVDDLNTGLFSDTADTLELVAGGVSAVTVTASAVTVGQNLLAYAGSAVTDPGIAFSDDPDTGFYLVGTNAMQIVTGGFAAISIASDQTVTIPVDLVITGNLTVNGGTTTLNVSTLDVEDADIVIGKNQLTATDSGITIEATNGSHTNGTFLYTSNATNADAFWTISRELRVQDDKLIINSGVGDASGAEGLVVDSTDDGTLYYTNADKWSLSHNLSVVDDKVTVNDDGATAASGTQGLVVANQGGTAGTLFYNHNGGAPFWNFNTDLKVTGDTLTIDAGTITYDGTGENMLIASDNFAVGTNKSFTHTYTASMGTGSAVRSLVQFDVGANSGSFMVDVSGIAHISSTATITTLQEDNGSDVVITTSATHNYSTGDKVHISGVTTVTAYNDTTHTITVTGGTTFTLNGTDVNANAGTGTGGTADMRNQYAMQFTSAVTALNGDLILSHLQSSGDIHPTLGWNVQLSTDLTSLDVTLLEHADFAREFVITAHVTDASGQFAAGNFTIADATATTYA